MQIGYIILFLFVFGYAQAQDCPKYAKAMDAGNQYLEQKNYDAALVQFQVAQIAARECGITTKLPATQLEKVFKGLQAQRDEAVQAKKDAEAQRTLADVKTKEALAQKEANQMQLARNYWNNSRTALRENNFLEALLYAAEGVATAKDETLRKTILIDSEKELPSIRIKNIFNSVGIDKAMYSPDGEEILTVSPYEPARLWSAKTGKQIAVLQDIDPIWNPVGAFSADGTQILLTYKYRNVFLFNAKTGKQIARIKSVNASAVLSPDKEHVLTREIRSDSAVSLWDAETGRQVAVLKHESPVVDATFSTDGKLVLTANDFGKARIWVAQTGKLLTVLQYEKGISSAAFSPDSKQVITASYSDSTARIWDIGTEKQIAVFKHTGSLQRALFSPNGKQVLTIDWNHTVCIWDIATGKLLSKTELLGNLDRPLFSPVFSPDGEEVLIKSADKTLDLIRLNTGSIMASVKTAGLPNSAVFSPDGKQILTADASGVIAIWNAETGGDLIAQTQCKGNVESAVFSPDGRNILTKTYNDDAAYQWEIISKKPTAVKLQHNSLENAFFTSDGKQVVAAGYADSTVVVCDAATGKLIEATKFPFDVRRVAYDRDRKYLLIAGEKSVSILDDKNKKQLVEIPFKTLVNKADFSKDGRRMLITTDNESLAHVYSIPAGRQMLVLKTVHRAIFSPDGTLLLSPDYEGTVRIWSTVTGKELSAFIPEEGLPLVAYSPDGKQILTKTMRAAPADFASLDLRQPVAIHIWNVSNQKQTATLRCKNDIDCAVFSPGGKQVLTASSGSDHALRLWDAATGKELNVLKHNVETWNAVFSPDGKLFATSGKGTNTYLWETATGKQIALFPDRDDENGAVFSPDGLKILINDSRGIAQIFPVPGDLDVPPDLFQLQVKVITGAAFNAQTSEVQVISPTEWYRLQDEYNTKAAAHYKVCKYPQYNFWSRSRNEE